MLFLMNLNLNDAAVYQLNKTQLQLIDITACINLNIYNFSAKSTTTIKCIVLILSVINMPHVYSKRILLCFR